MSTETTVTYKLQYPFHFGSELIEELEFKRPKLKHMKKIDAVVGDTAKTCKMIEVCTGKPPPIVDEIDMKDVEEIGKILADFQ